ncbi:UNVERIFIED_CONTAM: Patellin-3 [Sesamum radiatum]|uniref:Patellin-3 n=1 Tax=Sesamum radiatum TaxID=300843 RepID=A0AAW2T0L5_SESRA
MSGVDRQGHPICYNIFGVLDNEEIYEKTLATEEKREQFLEVEGSAYGERHPGT